jgi:hypothetical protein
MLAFRIKHFHIVRRYGNIFTHPYDPAIPHFNGSVLNHLAIAHMNGSIADKEQAFIRLGRIYIVLRHGRQCAKDA